MERRVKEYAAKTGGVIANMTAKAQEISATAANKANAAATVVGEKVGSLASVIRENAPHEGAAATAATTVVGGLESASSYLQEKKFNHVAKDVTVLVRTYPIKALLIGVGLGYFSGPALEVKPGTTESKHCSEPSFGNLWFVPRITFAQVAGI